MNILQKYKSVLPSKCWYRDFGRAAGKLICLLLLNGILFSASPVEAARIIKEKTPEQTVRVLGMIRRAIVTEALRYVGKPYRWGANGPSAYDCSGFVKAVYKAFGFELPRRSIEQGLSGFGIPVDLRYLRMGDIIYFYMRGKRYPHHIGIYMGRGLFIHSSSSRGVDIDILTGQWKQGARRASRLVLAKVN